MKSVLEQYFTSLRGKTIAVLGLGVSNRPLVQFLLQYGCRVIGCDRTPREKLDPEFLKWILWDGRTKQARKRYLDILTCYPEKTLLIKNQRQLNQSEGHIRKLLKNQGFHISK